MSKRELAEIVCHLAALTTENYEDALVSDEVLMARIREEFDALKSSGLI